MPRDFRDRFERWADRVEAGLMKTIVTLLVVFVMVQGLQASAGRIMLSSVNRYEEAAGVNWVPVEGISPTITVTLVNQSAAPKAVLLLNGREAADFSQSEVTVPVEAGDLVEIDTTSYRKPLKFRVSETHPRLLEPRTGSEIIVESGIEVLGRVILR